MNSPANLRQEFAQAVRGAGRTNLYLSATLLCEGARMAVTVRNLSTTGALVRARSPICEVGAVTLVRGSLRAPGTLAWKDGLNGGINFDEPIDLGHWAPGAPREGQRDVDRMIAQSRGQVAPLLPRRRPDIAPDEARRNLIARIAEELAFASRRLETMGSKLAEDPAVIARHGAQLQDLDITMQVLGHLGRLLSSEDPCGVLGGLGMEDLRRRLERTSLIN
jgi:hypothetical protein